MLTKFFKWRCNPLLVKMLQSSAEEAKARILEQRRGVRLSEVQARVDAQLQKLKADGVPEVQGKRVSAGEGRGWEGMGEVG